jgi:hypothetical protein
VSPGEIIGDAFGLYRAHWQHFGGVGLTVFFVVAMIALLLAFFGVVGLFLGQIVVIVGSIVLTGALVTAVDDVRDGRVDLSVGETIARVRPIFAVLLGVAIVAGIAIAIGLVFFIIPGLWLATIWFVLAPVVVLERAGFGESFGRSRSLVKQSGWATLGLLVLTFLILFAAGFIVALILSPFPVFLANFISVLVQGAVFAPFTSIVITLAYFKLRELEGAAAPELGVAEAG